MRTGAREQLDGPKIRMVGVRGFEPPTPCSQSRCATGLRHTPNPAEIISFRRFAAPHVSRCSFAREELANTRGRAKCWGKRLSTTPPSWPRRTVSMASARNRRLRYARRGVSQGLRRRTTIVSPTSIVMRSSPISTGPAYVVRVPAMISSRLALGRTMWE
jgi:hypothetical protein